jgi:dihydrofolate synthase/folylpolyglutamate synthase
LTDVFPCVEEVNRLDLDGPMTQFEIISAMSFKLAEMEKLKVMVMEAGMGGRWDATNAADAKIVGLTGVDLEHTEILGNTIEEIALEKVQVIKKDALAATLSADRTVLDVMEKQASGTDSKMFLYGKDFNILKKVKNYPDGWKVDIKGINRSYTDLNIPLLGDYQPYNLSLALVLSELYTSTLKKDINEKDLKKSLLKVRVPGRFEILQKDPVVIADSSHNPAGMDNFVKNMEESFKGRKKIIIFSVLKDKDYLNMIRSMLPSSSTVLLTSSNTSRSLGIDELEKETLKIIKDIRKNGVSVPERVYKIDSISNSLKYALKIAESNDIICITGSITNLENIV